MKFQGRSPALLALAALAILWGYNWVAMKVASQYAAPLNFAALRLLLGAAVLFVVLIAMRRPLRVQHFWTVFWIGIFQSALFLGLAMWAVHLAGAGKVAILAYTMPLWVAVLGWPVLGERLRAIHGVALAVAIVGVLLILNVWGSGNSLAADGIALAAGASWAVGVLIAKRLQMRVRVDVLNLTTWQMALGGVALGLAALVVPETPTHWTLPYIAALAYNVVPATAVAYVLWLYILGRLSARDAGMGTLGNPIVGIVAAWLQLGETPPVSEAAGMGLIVGALAILGLSASREQSTR